MKRRLTIAFLCLATVLVLGGCTSKDTGSHTTPSQTPSVTPSAGVDDNYQADEHGNVDDIPNATDNMTNHDDTANSAQNNNTTRPDDATGDGVLHDVGDAVEDVADGTERAVRDIF